MTTFHFTGNDYFFLFRDHLDPHSSFYRKRLLFFYSATPFITTPHFTGNDSHSDYRDLADLLQRDSGNRHSLTAQGVIETSDPSVFGLASDLTQVRLYLQCILSVSLSLSLSLSLCLSLCVCVCVCLSLKKSRRQKIERRTLNTMRNNTTHQPLLSKKTTNLIIKETKIQYYK